MREEYAVRVRKATADRVERTRRSRHVPNDRPSTREPIPVRPDDVVAGESEGDPAEPGEERDERRDQKAVSNRTQYLAGRP